MGEEETEKEIIKSREAYYGFLNGNTHTAAFTLASDRDVYINRQSITVTRLKNIYFSNPYTKEKRDKIEWAQVLKYLQEL